MVVGELWGNKRDEFRHRVSSTKGIILGKLTWLRRAKKALQELEILLPLTASASARYNMIKRLTQDRWKDLPSFNTWGSENTATRLKWAAKIKNLYSLLNLDLKRLEAKERWERKERSDNFFITEGGVNSAKFRRWKLKTPPDPDGEAVKTEEGKIIVGEEEVKARFAEYYGNLFCGEATRTTAPTQTDREAWMKPSVIAENRRKLHQATGGISVIATPPTLEEYMFAVNKGDPQSSGGPDRIQYGVLQKLSTSTHMIINGKHQTTHFKPTSTNSSNYNNSNNKGNSDNNNSK